MWKEYCLATSVEKALQVLDHWQGKARLIAGGSDLFIDIQDGRHSSDCVVDITRIPGLDTIENDSEYIYVGANTTFHSLWTSYLIGSDGHALAEASRTVAAWSVQNVGTLAGNVVTAQPAADGSLALIALGAEAEIAWTGGRRWQPVQELFAGPGRSHIDPTREMITRFRWHKIMANEASVYERIAKRETMALPIACCGIALKLDDNRERIDWVRIALGPVAETPFRAVCAEDLLRGSLCNPDDLEQAAVEAAGACQMRTNKIRASKEYRSEVVKVLVKRALKRAVTAARSGPQTSIAGRFTWKRSWAGLPADPPAAGQIRFTLNGEPMTVPVQPGESLASLLREELNLTGTKVGCDEGDCGACTVLVDGQPVTSCIFPAMKAHGRQVQTIEGLARAGQLNPVQKALVDLDAIQCGFCTPGVCIAATVLLQDLPDPTPQEIREALGNNYCRCTGYVKIVEAIKQADRYIRHPELEQKNNSVPRKDAIARVTGSERYASDIKFEGMLHGKIVWSQYPHAEILNIDTSLAAKTSGVVRVLTHKDVTGKNLFGSWGYDQPVFAEEKVRFLGEVIAVVLADNLAAAEEGARQVHVEYRELPVVCTPQEGLESGAPVIKGEDNIIYRSLVEKGDVDLGFSQADVVVEDDYTTQTIEHAFLETEAGIGVMEGDVVVVHQATQWPPGDRQQVADVLGLPIDRVRVVQTPIGGAFGGKMDLTVQPLVALGAYLTGKPVKIVLTRPESIRMHVKRHPFWLHYKLGATHDGRIVAMKAHLLLDSGAYRSTTDDVLEQATVFSSGPYAIANLHVTGIAVRTNNVTTGAMRGFGAPQVCFAMESTIDQLARHLKMDPFTIRRINMLDIGSELVTGQILKHSVGAKPVLNAAEAAFKRWGLPQSRPGKRIGVGIGAGMKNVGLGIGGDDSVYVSIGLERDGNILLRHGATDMGQGSNTVMCQIASQILNIPSERVKYIAGDTTLGQDGGITAASRQTYITGRATAETSQLFKIKLFEYVGQSYGVNPQRLTLTEDGLFIDLDSERPVANLKELGKIAADRGDPITVIFHYKPQRTYRILSPEKRQEMGLTQDEYINYPALCYMCHVVVVEVDEETGHVEVLKVFAAHDAGHALIPTAIEGQIQGGVVMGLGYALTEEFVQEKGKILSDSLHKIVTPRSTMAAEIESIIVEDPDPGGPFGAKGMAEAGAVATAPAVTNAIYDAIGVRIKNLPATKDKVLLGYQSLKSQLDNQ